MRIYIFQIIAFIVALSIAISIIKMTLSIKKERHISSFSLDKVENQFSIGTNINIKLWHLIDKLSFGLSKYKYINKLAKNYDKYILYVERKYKNNIDYVVIKILFMIVAIISSIIIIIIGLIPKSIISLILCLIISYITPDLIWQYTYQKRLNKINADLFNAIKYINFSISKDASLSNAIKYAISNLSGPIKDELEKIDDDLSFNINATEAFKRFYKRSRLTSAKFIYNSFAISKPLEVSDKETINNIFLYMQPKQERKEKFYAITSSYNYFFLVVLIIPLLVFVFGVSINIGYFNRLFTSYMGTLSLIMIIIVYTVYIWIIESLLEVKDE